MSELKPCPFCGGEAELHCNSDETLYGVYCPSCGAQTAHEGFATDQEAVAAWNRRAEPANALTLDELRGMRGNPVYVVRLHYGVLDENDIRASGWFLVEPQMVHRRSGTYSENYYWDEYGKTWLAYRRRPEWGQTK